MIPQLEWAWRLCVCLYVKYKIRGCVLQDVFDHLKTPGNKPQQSEGAETPLSEVIERNLKAAVANSNRTHVKTLAALTASPHLGKEPEPKINEQVFITFMPSPLCANISVCFC